MDGESAVIWNPFAPQYFQDPYPLYAACRKHNPVQKDQFGNVILFKYRDIAPILDSQDFEVSSLAGYFDSKQNYIFQHSNQCPFLAKTTQKWLMYLNGDVHRKFRVALGKALFSYDFSHFIQQGLAHTMDHFKGELELNLVDFAKHFIYQVLGKFMGLTDQATLERIVEYSNMAAYSQDLFVSKQMYLKINECLVAGQGLFSDEGFKARLKEELAGIEMDEMDYYSLLSVTTMAFFETSKDNLSYALYLILSNPNLRNYVLEANKQSIKILSEELIRYTSPLQFTIRINTQDFQLQGNSFPKGTRFILGLASANRDEEIFSSSEEILPNRTQNPHLAFGSGSHFCLGTVIARKEMELALQPMIEFFKGYEMAKETALEWGNQIFMRTLHKAIIKRV